MAKQNTSPTEGQDTKECVTRRKFLLAGGTVGAAVLLTTPGIQGEVWAATTKYPRKKVASLSKLKTDVPVEFDYPDADSPAMLVKLGVAAGGGIGAGSDVVAFSTLCTHMGGAMDGTYKAKHKGLGPCPLHLTTFDLTRHGIMIAGHATESLPQVVLEVDGDAIYATGVMGLIYGKSSNV
ncbi:MAG: arsenate reductase (azurin) small subunit [Rhodospirillaceae bacterium]|jgi:arsenite oxidase small subunit|nr:arsenate reductase (azurin) small subunit [Rhodospirillaceae bacterium]